MGKLTKQQQQLIGAIVFLVVGGGYFYWSYMLKPTMAQITEREAKYKDLTAKIETAERQARRLPALQLEYATLQQDLLSLEKQLPTDKDLPNIIRVLTRQALQENLQFMKLAPKPSIHQTYFEIIPFDLQFSGTLHSLARFLAALGQQDRIFQAQNLNLSVISSSDPSAWDASEHIASYSDLCIYEGGRMKLSTSNFILCSVLLISNIGCGSKSVDKARKPAPVIAAPITPLRRSQKKNRSGVYSGDRFRDPFVPAGQSSAYQADAVFDPQRATVKGIVFGGQQKGAVLNVGGTGTYFVRDGRIIDIMGKLVEGFTAKVLVNKVIVQSSDDSTYELKIKGSDEEGKPS